MVHQFGHVLGLAHTNRVTSVMMPYYNDWIAESELAPDTVDMDMVKHVTNTGTDIRIHLLVLCLVLLRLIMK